MEVSRLIAHTATALDKLQYQRKQSIDFCDIIELEIIMRWLRVVRTFCFCSMMLANNVELRIEGNNDNAVSSLRSRKKRMKRRKRRMIKGLGSLLVRVEDMVSRILDDHISYDRFGFQCDMESSEEEMDKWYTTLSSFLQQYSTSPLANQIEAITDSVLEDLKDYLSTEKGYDSQFVNQVFPIEYVTKNFTFLKYFVRFGTFLCAENQYLLAQIEPLAIGAAHFTLQLFSNVRGPIPLPNGLTSSMVDNSVLCESYTLALASLKHSLELYNPSIDMNDYPFTIIVNDFVASLLCTLWKMLQLDTVSVVSRTDKQSTRDRKLQPVYQGLTFLRIILKNHPEKFDDGKIRDTVVAAVCDAGVVIFSLDRKDFEIDHAFQEFLENIQGIRLELIGCVFKTNFPQTNVLGFLDFLIEDYMEEVKGSRIDSNTLSSVPNIQEYLVFLKSFVRNLMELRNLRKNAHQDLWDLSVEVAYKIESLIDQLVLEDTLDSLLRSLQTITEGITFIKANSLNIFDEGSQDINKVWEITEKVPSIISSAITGEVVGFESEKASTIDRLLGGFSKLKVVSVVGMPGSGKTTLATKVYQDSFVTHHFHKMASCSISQVFDRRKVLLELLNQTKACEIKPTWDENDLSQELRKSLKGYKYLIFIDDIWDAEAFEILKESLPDDYNGSRILLTSRHGDVVPEDLLDDKPLLLPLFTKEQSLELLQRKIFPYQNDWPSELHEIGMKIAEYCKGLPLTLVLVAGLLKTKEQEGWKDVLKPLRSSIISDPIVCTIELSYTHLPGHLKPLFLWLGAYPEDREISVKDMIWLWISEGLVRKFESKSPEEVARGYINILIARGLVMVARRRSAGGVKTCRIHDLLRDFCLIKANEEFFLHILEADADEDQKELFLDEPDLSSPVYLRNIRRLCIYSKPELWKWEVLCPPLRALIFFGATEIGQKLDVSVIFRMFKLLRVLGIGGIELIGFPSEIGVLSQLRYLAIEAAGLVDPALGNLSNLEILILSAEFGVDEVINLPDTIWNLRKLRHLCIDRKYENSVIFELPIDNLDNSSNLVELQTLSTLYCGCWSIMKKQLNKFPRICKLRCLMMICEEDIVSDIKVVDFSHLTQLDSLFYDQPISVRLNKFIEVVFPENIKKLTLKRCEFPWSKMSSIAKLPHLAVLKLLGNAFIGKTWEFEEEEFPNLKLLKLEGLSIVKWTAASNDQFPKLEMLVLSHCYHLQEIPEDCMGNVETLKAIEVVFCSRHVVSQVRKIEETQKEYGTLLQVHVRDSNWCYPLMRRALKQEN